MNVFGNAENVLPMKKARRGAVQFDSRVHEGKAASDVSADGEGGDAGRGTVRATVLAKVED